MASTFDCLSRSHARMIPAYLIISKMKEGEGRERGRGEEEERRGEKGYITYTTRVPR